MSRSSASPTGDAGLSRAERRDQTARAFTTLARTGPSDQRTELLDHVVRLNMGVARSVASRYFRRGLDDDDLVQVAYLALTRAARQFDPEQEHDFLSYAVPTISGELKKHFRDLGWTVRPPRRVQEMQARIGRAEGDLVQLHGRPPYPREVATHLGVELEGVLEALAAEGCFTPSSLDWPASPAPGTDARTVGDLFGEDDPAHLAAEARAALAPLVRNLKERDRRILYMRFWEGLSQLEIGQEIGVTQMQISRLLTRIMRDLRRELSAGPQPQATVSARATAGRPTR